MEFLTGLAEAAWALRWWIVAAVAAIMTALWFEAEGRAIDLLLEADGLDAELEQVTAERDRLLELTRVEIPLDRPRLIEGPVIDR